MEGRLEGDSLEKGSDKHSVAHQTLSWLPVISEISVGEVGGLLVVTHTTVDRRCCKDIIKPSSAERIEMTATPLTIQAQLPCSCGASGNGLLGVRAGRGLRSPSMHQGRQSRSSYAPSTDSLGLPGY